MLRIDKTLTLTLMTSAALFGCNTMSHIGGDTDSGTGVTCGEVTCAEGQVCCNESCGICAAPGEGCITLYCEPGDDGGSPPTTDGAVPPPPTTDGGTPPPPPPVDGGTGEPCGPVTCGPDTVCCNASCGICTAPEESCPAIACADAGPPPSTPCDAWDAHGEGFCDLFLGYAWNGTDCVGLSGCECIGADCPRLTSIEECRAMHDGCTPPGEIICGGFAGFTCPSGMFCDYPDGSYCGGDDSTGVCRDIPGPECIEIYAPVCGCDGITYSNSCFANAAGTDYIAPGTCESMSGGSMGGAP